MNEYATDIHPNERAFEIAAGEGASPMHVHPHRRQMYVHLTSLRMNVHPVLHLHRVSGTM